jgi:hypothetical protein
MPSPVNKHREVFMDTANVFINIEKVVMNTDMCICAYSENIMHEVSSSSNETI